MLTLHPRPGAVPAHATGLVAPFVERRGRGAANWSGTPAAVPHALPQWLPQPAAWVPLASPAGAATPDADTTANAHNALAAQQLGQVLDLLDYGLILVGHDGQVKHCNRAAAMALQADHPLQLQGGQVQARQRSDGNALREAVACAAQRGLRRLLALGPGPQKHCVAVLPLPPLAGQAGADHGVALLLSRSQVCEQLTVEWFARSHSLTMAETAVVKGLCANLTPQQIADEHGVGLATVRTQIGSVRQKTGASSIPALLRQVATLPPMVSVLHSLLGGLGQPGLRAVPASAGVESARS
jgi:DNA-binding CsgD family transcriptional regulator